MTNGKNDLPALLVTLLITLSLLGGSLWFFGRRLLSDFNASNPLASPAEQQSLASNSSPSAQSAAGSTATLDLSQPDPAVLTIDGSVSLVALIKQLQLAYSQVNPNLNIAYGLPEGKPNGTNSGIQNLIQGQVAMAVSSRPLKPEERQAGLQAIPIARDALAVAVSVENPYQGGLTLDQLKQIFQAKITNWSQVGGPNLPIRVVNRSRNSGSYSFFQDMVLLGEPFGIDNATFTTAVQDETTPLLRSLGRDGITYSSITQVVNQRTVRVVPIDGLAPTNASAVTAGNYPISRITYLVVPQKTSPAVKQFIELALSPQGQQIVKRVGFSPI